MYKRIVFLCLVALLASSAVACAPKKIESAAAPTVMVWPDPPDEPRIAYVGVYYGARDFYHPNFFQALFGTPPGGVLYKPAAVYASGKKIYVALSGSKSVAVIDPSEQTYDQIADWGKGKIGLPLGLAGLPDGALYVSDATAKRILVFDKDEQFKSEFGMTEGLKNPTGIAFNAEHTRLYVADSKANDVKVFSPDGKFLFKFGSQGNGPGQFYFPTSVAVSPKTDDVCIVDTANFRVQIFDKDGKFIRTFGSLGDAPGMFSRPKGAAFDSEGHLYVSDYAFGNVQVFEESGQLLMWFGSTGSILGRFELPYGLFIDDHDRIYVADSLNNRVQVFQYLSEAWKREHPDQYRTYINAGAAIPK